MKKVLIIDDEPSILMSLDFLMKKEGYEVFIARDGKEAFSILEKDIPDLIILDIMMPNVDGYEVCRHIRKTPGLMRIKIILLSAKTSHSDIEKGYNLGADEYMLKPFSTKELVKKVKGLL